MSRYIDADVLEYDTEWSEYHDGFTAYSQMAIDTAPSIDIVRCQDCKHCKRRKGTFRGEPIFFYRCAEHNRDVESDDYCSWAERRADDD